MEKLKFHTQFLYGVFLGLETHYDLTYHGSLVFLGKKLKLNINY